MIMLLCTPPRKYLLKKSCTLTALALLIFYANGSLANEFLVNKDNPWTGGRTLTFISDETNLSNHILTVDAQDNFWTGYKPTEIKLISIDDSKSENLSIVGNKAYIQNVDNITPCFIEISGTKNTEISGNLIEITNSASGQIRGMFVTNGTKAENILVQKNQIKIQLKDSDSTSQAQAINISGSGKIDDNTMEISGGGKSTRLIGVSGTNKTEALDITNNRLTIHDANFRFATTVSVSNTPYGIIQERDYTAGYQNVNGYSEAGIRISHVDARVYNDNHDEYLTTNPEDGIGYRVCNTKGGRQGYKIDSDYWPRDNGTKQSYTLTSIFESYYNTSKYTLNAPDYGASNSSLFGEGDVFTLNPAFGWGKNFMPSGSNLWNKAKTITGWQGSNQTYEIDETMTCDYYLTVLSIEEDAEHGYVAQVQVEML